MEDIFNAEWVSDPKLVYQTINIMCKSIMDTSLKQRPFLIGISTTTFCYQHVLTYKRNYDYAWEVINGTSMGYYTGVEIPPYQMDGWQYSGKRNFNYWYKLVLTKTNPPPPLSALICILVTILCGINFWFYSLSDTYGPC